MNALETLSARLIEALSSPVPLLLAKITLLLAVAWLIHAALARQNPRWRVLMWRLTAVGCVLLAGLTACPPLFEWAVLPDVLPEAAAGDAAAVAENVGRPASGEAPQSTAAPARADAAEQGRGAVPEPPGAGFAESDPAVAPTPPVERSRTAALQPAPQADGRPADGGWAGWAMLVWCGGLAALALRTTLGMLRVRAICRRAAPVDGEVADRAIRIARDLGIGSAAGATAGGRRDVCPTIHQSTDVPTPCLVGLCRPTILLPASPHHALNRDELTAVLAHELAHVRGRDLLWNAVLHTLAHLLWFHPLAWRVRATHAAACDAVCDAVAADYLGDTHRYTRTLARLAVRAATPITTAGLAMAGASSVRGRITALQGQVFRGSLSRVRVLLFKTLGLILVANVGTTAITQAQNVPEREPARQAADAAPPSKAADNAGPAEQPTSEGGAGTQEVQSAPLYLTVRLVDEEDRPVEGVWVGKSASGQTGREPVWSFYLPNSTSDAGGVATFLTRDLGRGPVVLYALHEGRQLAAFHEVDPESAGPEVEITLQPACRVHGRVVSTEMDEIGRDATDVSVRLYRGERSDLYYDLTDQHFEFFLPAGDYRLKIDGAALQAVDHAFTVQPGAEELKIDPFDLPVERILKWIGKPAPELRNIRAWKNGPPVTLADLRGKIVLLNFWGEGRGVYSADMPFWMALHDAFHEEGVVVLGVHDDSVRDIAEMDKRFARARDHMWHGRDIPFPVALDGGGETTVDGTDLNAKGHTTATYGIGTFNAGLLIDRQGKVVTEFHPLNAEHLNTLRRMVGVQTDKSPFTLTHTPGWMRRFHASYGLEPGQALRLIPPPFPSERAAFVTLNYRVGGEDGGVPPRLTILDDGKLKAHSRGTAKLGEILRSLRPPRAPDDLIDCPVLFAKIELPGDWVVRKDATLAERLDVLQDILNQVLDRPIRIRRDEVERDTIVVRGSYQFAPLAGAHDDQTINITADPLDLLQ